MPRELSPLSRVRAYRRMTGRGTRLKSVAILGAACALVSGAVASRAQTPPPSGPSQTPSDQQGTLPAGALPLPQTPPPTGLQAPVPPPAAPFPKPNFSRPVSPTLRQLTGKAQTQPLTINDAIAVALSTNKTLALSVDNLLAAQGRTSEARSAYNPTLGSTLAFTHLNQGTTATFGNQTLTLVNQDQGQINLLASLPIDISGLLRAATEQAQFEEIAARLDVNRVRNQIVSDVKTAYYNVLRAQAQVRVAQENLQNASDNYTDAERRFRAGTVARFDVFSAQTTVANGQQALIATQNQVSLAIAALNNTIGIDVNTPLQVTNQGAVELPPGIVLPEIPSTTLEGQGSNPGGPPPQPESAPGADPPQMPQGPANAPTASAGLVPSLELGPEYDAALHEALRLRPEIMEADANIAAARKGIVLAYRSILPTLGLTWGLAYAPNTAGFAPQTTTWEGVAQLNLPLYDGGVARSRVRQARANVATAETNRRISVDESTLR